MCILSVIKRIAACALAVIITVGAFGSPENENSVITMASPEISNYEQRLQEIEEEQSKLDEKIAAAEKSISGQKDKLSAVNDKIKTVKKKIKTVKEYSAEIENEMVKLDSEMRQTIISLEKKENDIKSGVNDFMSRLRAMYVAGVDTYTDVLVNSSDFYDVLMRLELVKRVAEHDNDAINKLIEQKKDIENTKSELEKQSDALKIKSQKYGEQQKSLADQQNELLKLQSEYGDKIAELENDKSDFASQSQKLDDEYNKVSSQAQTTTTTKKTTTSKTTTATTTKKSVTDKKPASTTVPESAPPTTTVTPDNPPDKTTVSQPQTPDEPEVPSLPDSDKADIVVSYAKSMVGGSYVWGGSSFGATDCSGLIMLSYAQVGITLPHFAAWQANYGTDVAYNDMQPGDCIFFGGSSYSSIYHVAMYIGDGRMVHAENTYTGIVISDVAMFSQYNNITCIKRLL